MSMARVGTALALVCALAGGAVTLSVPAKAQFFEDRFSWGGRSQPHYRDRDSFPFFGRDFFRSNRSRPSDSDAIKPPVAKKLDTPPSTTVAVIGDSLGDWLAYGLEETFTDTPDVGVVRKIRPSSGVVRLDPKADTFDYPAAVKDILGADRPNAIVVMLGVNDRVSLRERAIVHPVQPAAQGQEKAQEKAQDKDKPQEKGAQEKAGQEKEKAGVEKASQEKAAQEKGGKEKAEEKTQATQGQLEDVGPSFDFHTDKWAEIYQKRVEEFITALKIKGVPILWVGMPSIRGTRATTDMSYLDEIYRAAAEKTGIIYVDIWDGFVDEGGRYTAQGPDFEGQTRRLRTGDGVNFTKPGAVKLAHYVEKELRRVITAHPVPVALPGPEEQAPAKPGAPGAPAAGPAARPVAGPVLPLTAATAAGGDNSKDLIGTGSRATAVSADPMAVRVLSHGDPIVAPTGRADDFSWPHRSSGTVDEPDPVLPTPPAPKKADDGKAKAAADAATPRRRGRADVTSPRAPVAIGTTGH